MDSFEKAIPMIQSMEDELLGIIRMDEATLLNYLNQNVKLVGVQF
jgi:hypothetical protein